MNKLLITVALAVTASMPASLLASSASAASYVRTNHNVSAYGDGFVKSTANKVGDLKIGHHVTAQCYQSNKDARFDTVRVNRAGEFTGYVSVRFYDSNNNVSSTFSMTPTELRNALPNC